MQQSVEKRTSFIHTSGKKNEVIVVGGGVIGCSIAYQLAKKGQSVTLLERGRVGKEASSAAAGMLAAQAEMEDTGPLFQWASRSRGMFPQLSDELKQLTGIDISLVREGLLNLALTGEQEEELRQREKLQRAAGERVAWLEPEELLRMEPALTSTLRGGLFLPEDGQVEAPLLAEALALGARMLGVKIQEFTPVQHLVEEHGRVIGVMTSEGPIYSECVVVATGAWSSELLGGVGVATYPVKGECFSVVASSRLLSRTLFSPGCYIVPKAGGRLLVGATVRTGTFDRSVTIQGLSALMNRAQALLPAIAEAEFEKAWAGLRPQTTDGLPYIGRVSSVDGLFAACGHYRNGILLTPITGEVMAKLVLDYIHPTAAEFSCEEEPAAALPLPDLITF